MNLQDAVDGWNARMQRDRAGSQLTLGGLIAALEAMPEGSMVADLCEPGSYRGYYCDMYFECGTGTRPAADLLADCRRAMGAVFEGYKGGEYVMGALTPLWVASYGCTGRKLMAVHTGGQIETADDE